MPIHQKTLRWYPTWIPWALPDRRWIQRHDKPHASTVSPWSEGQRRHLYHEHIGVSQVWNLWTPSGDMQPHYRLLQLWGWPQIRPWWLCQVVSLLQYGNGHKGIQSRNRHTLRQHLDNESMAKVEMTWSDQFAADTAVPAAPRGGSNPTAFQLLTIVGYPLAIEHGENPSVICRFSH